QEEIGVVCPFLLALRRYRDRCLRARRAPQTLALIVNAQGVRRSLDVHDRQRNRGERNAGECAPVGVERPIRRHLDVAADGDAEWALAEVFRVDGHSSTTISSVSSSAITWSSLSSATTSAAT